MISFRYFILLLLVVGSHMSFGQRTDPFTEQLQTIQNRLTILSDSVAPGLTEDANFSVAGVSIQTFLRTLAETHNLNIQIDPSLDISITNNFNSVRVQDLIMFLCQEYRISIRFVGAIMSFAKYVEPYVEPAKAIARKPNLAFNAATGRITFDFANDSLRAIVKELTRLTNRNVVAAFTPELEGKMITGYMKDIPLESALEKLAYTNSLRLTKSKDGVIVFENGIQSSSTNNGSNGSQNIPTGYRNVSGSPLINGHVTYQDTLFNIDVTNTPIMEVIKEAAESSGKSYIFFTEITGNTTVKVKGVSFDHLLAFILQGTTFTYKKSGLVYVLGQKTQDGFKSTQLVKLEFRTIEGIEKEIPTDLLKEVEVRSLKELNSFIITGNENRILELIAFLKMIDKPVPNILIEVIVAEARKNFTMQVGIQAFLADSVPKTGGTIFPGVDMTLSSKSVNNVLQKLSDNGIANLGRVTPNFYATIKALEDNENIQIRSTPKLSTMNGNKANLTIGQSQYYLEQTQNITAGVGPVQTISNHYIKVDANLSITISPIVSGNEHITLDIIAEFSSFTPPTGVNAPPGSQTRKFESKIRVRNEDVIILGGMEELSKADGGTGVPLLSRIPVLKWFFSSRTKKKVDNRLIVFIKPTIVY